MAAPETSERPAVRKFLESLPDDVRQTVEALRGVQAECDIVRAEFLKESKVLEEKYRELYDPLYKKRSQLLMGGEQPPAEGLGAVPGFWLRVLKASETLVDHVSRKDEPILKYLIDVSSGKIEGSPGFKLVFQFAPNPYFEPLTLEKKYFMDNDDESILVKSEGAKITWTEGKNPMFKVIKRKSDKGASKVIEKSSFFDFFTPPKFDGTEDEEGEHAEHVAEIAELLAEDDFEMGCYIKEVLIPSAVSLFTGEMKDEDEDDEDDDDEDEESSDEYSSSDDE